MIWAKLGLDLEGDPLRNLCEMFFDVRTSNRNYKKFEKTSVGKVDAVKYMKENINIAIDEDR